MDEEMKKPWFESAIASGQPIYRCPKADSCELLQYQRCQHQHNHYEMTSCTGGSGRMRCPKCEVVGYVRPKKGSKVKHYWPKVSSK